MRFQFKRDLKIQRKLTSLLIFSLVIGGSFWGWPQFHQIIAEESIFDTIPETSVKENLSTIPTNWQPNFPPVFEETGQVRKNDEAKIDITGPTFSPLPEVEQLEPYALFNRCPGNLSEIKLNFMTYPYYKDPVDFAVFQPQDCFLCLSEWENTYLNMSVLENNGENVLTVFTDNGITKLNTNVPAQIYCRSFSGDILEDTTPKKIRVRFSWGVEYPQDVPAPEDVLESISAPVEQTTSLLNFFIDSVYTEKIFVETMMTPDVIYEKATTSPQNVLSASEAVSSGLVEVLYTLDGVEWKSLGFVEKDEFDDKYFEIPIEEALDWEAISKIQISIQSVPILDGIASTIYLNSVWLEVEYQELLEDPFTPPGQKEGDIIFSEISHNNMVAVLVERNSILVIGTPVYELWLASTPADFTQSLITEEMVEKTVPEKREWRFIADKPLSKNTHIIFEYGNIFWFEPGGFSVWRFNIGSNAYDSMAVNPGEKIEFFFEDESGEPRVFEKDDFGLGTINEVIVNE